jgi:hypothetical protein
MDRTLDKEKLFKSLWYTLYKEVRGKVDASRNDK